MAVCWRCPSCQEVSCEIENAAASSLACDHCQQAVMPHEALCTVCESPNPWTRRDTLHFVCRECGNSQTFYWNFGVAS